MRLMGKNVISTFYDLLILLEGINFRSVLQAVSEIDSCQI